MLRDLLTVPAWLQRRLTGREAGDGPIFAQRKKTPQAPSAYLGDHTSLTMLQSRLKIFVDTRGNDVAPHILLDGEWEPYETRLFAHLIRRGDTVLDLGAHLGVFTLVAAAATGATGQVHGFEPNPRFAGLLHRSLAVNGFSDHARVHNIAIGAEEGAAMLMFTYAWGGGGHLAVSPTEGLNGVDQVRCRVVALDEMFPDPDFQVHVMKMDVEGTESRAMRGMAKLLRRSPRAKVMFEFAPVMLAAQGSSAAELVQLFSELGFRFWLIGNRAALQEIEASALMTMDEGVRNILASREHPLQG